MALTKQKKEQQVQKLAGELKDSTSAIIGTFAKLTVAQDFALRQKVREAGGKYRVLKNKLAARAGEGTKVEQALKGLKGVSSVAYTNGDPVTLAKAVSTWVAENSEFAFKLGIVDGKLITVEEIKQLATMPGKEELFSKLLFLIQSPAQRLVTVMNAVGRDLAVVIDQGVKENKFAGGAAPVAAAEAPAAEAPVAAAPAAEQPKAEAAAPAATAEPVATTEAPAAAEVEAPAAGTSTDPVEGATAEETAAPVETAEVAPEKQAEAAATEAPVEGGEEPAS